MEATHLSKAIGAALDVDVVATSRVTGGDVAEAARFELDDGRVIFVKTHRNPPDNFFTTEAQGLAWLSEPGVVHVPSVLAVSDGSSGEPNAATPAFLVLAWIETGGTVADPLGDSDFGRALAQLHRTGFARFGRSDRRPTGSRSLPNQPCDTWVEFFGTQRLIPLLRMARADGALADETLLAVEWILDHLDELGVPIEPPARLHGDLWAGNRLVDSGGRSWLIDPASHGGHREFDLAMMQLFGGFSTDCFAAYHEEFPLAAGWQDRVPLHQLAPLIVHAIKFGGSYPTATHRAATSVRQHLA